MRISECHYCLWHIVGSANFIWKCLHSNHFQLLIKWVVSIGYAPYICIFHLLFYPPNAYNSIKTVLSSLDTSYRTQFLTLAQSAFLLIPEWIRVLLAMRMVIMVVLGSATGRCANERYNRVEQVLRQDTQMRPQAPATRCLLEPMLLECTSLNQVELLSLWEW